MPKKAEKPKKIAKTRPKSRKKDHAYATGGRKTASSQIRLFKGKGETMVNGKPIGQYFPGEIAKIIYTEPFLATETVGQYYATIKVRGSGKSGQLGAVVHGLARALDKENRELYRSALKQRDLLTRDARMKERRKPGYAQKARAKKQSPKR